MRRIDSTLVSSPASSAARPSTPLARGMVARGMVALELVALGMVVASPDASALAQDAETSESDEGESVTLRAPSEATPSASPAFRIGGYVETDYAFSFAEPSNGQLAFRGFDNRHNTFTIQNVALDAQWDHEDLVGRVTLQVGHTGAAYYLSETSRVGSSSVGATSASLFQFVQQAYAGYRVPIGNGLTVTAGVFLSPIGPESMAVHDDWNWSRSDLFFGCPFYHTGIRLSYPLDDAWTVNVYGLNGWNSIVDNNDEKSLAAQLVYAGSDLSASLLYFTGVERPTGAPEGRAWRHLFDAYATWTATEWLALMGHVDGGFEPNAFGTSGWLSTALYARLSPIRELSVALRGDVFYESLGRNALGTASSIFWPATSGTSQYVSSGTVTLDVHPVPRASLRVEYRHDHAGSPIYFGGHVETDSTGAFVANRASQDSLTVGMTTWF